MTTRTIGYFFGASLIAALAVMAPGAADATSKLMTLVNSKPITMEKCRNWAKNSDQVKNFIDAFDASNDDKNDMIEVAAITCFVTHNPLTSSWSKDKQVTVIAYRLTIYQFPAMMD